MEIIKSLFCESNAIMIACYVLDVVLILGAITFFIWYFVKNSKKNNVAETKPLEDVEKINDDTYVIAKDEEEVSADGIIVAEPLKQDNAVEHFANQLSNINEPQTNEMKSSAVIVNHEVEQPVKKIVKKDEINNYVMIDGVKKEKSENEIEKSFNRGSDAYKNSSNFLNAIKVASNEESKPEAPKPATAVKKTTKK